MRVLLATDGSESSDRARDLIAGLSWPQGTIVRAVIAVETHLEMLGAPFAMASGASVDELDQELFRHAELTLDAVEQRLTPLGLKVERVIAHDRAANAIVEEAHDWKASLVILGSRGHSPLTTAVLGSTSAEVVDHAPCPVLVAREGAIGEIGLAYDGSAGSTLAAGVLTEWPIFRALPVTVVTVTGSGMLWHSSVAGSLFDPASVVTAHDVDVALQGAAELAESVAVRLRQDGLRAVSEVREGDAAAELVNFSHGKRHPLLIMGSRGHTGIARLLLGGVARNVLNHAAASVLIVREGTHVDRELPVEERAPVAVG
jgi:nucleotide-binding universal stress UspA family protein